MAKEAKTKGLLVCHGETKASLFVGDSRIVLIIKTLSNDVIIPIYDFPIRDGSFYILLFIFELSRNILIEFTYIPRNFPPPTYGGIFDDELLIIIALLNLRLVPFNYYRPLFPTFAVSSGGDPAREEGASTLQD